MNVIVTNQWLCNSIDNKAPFLSSHFVDQVIFEDQHKKVEAYIIFLVNSYGLFPIGWAYQTGQELLKALWLQKPYFKLRVVSRLLGLGIYLMKFCT